MNVLEKRIQALESIKRKMMRKHSFESLLRDQHHHNGEWDSGYNYDSIPGETSYDKRAFLIKIGNGNEKLDLAMTYEIRYLVTMLV